MRVVLVELRSKGERSRMDELKALVKTLGHEIIGAVQQIRDPDPAYLIGRGKARELADLVRSAGADRVVFWNQLTPSQAHKLSRLVGKEVIDRFQLILEIFAMRASSPEAKLQVEYARLTYELPRIRERVREALSVEQPGLMGGGEYEVNVYFDMVKRKLANLRKKLAEIRKAREQRRKLRRRRGFRLVAIAGYTNSGKSTLLQALTSARTEIDNMYFTTLMPRTRAVRGASKVLVTDTVGFMDGLPPWLFEAFKATLEEVYTSDLVLLVVDASDPLPEMIRKFRVSRNVISEYRTRSLLVLNKVDLIDDEELDEKVNVMQGLSDSVIPISALRGTNLNILVEKIRSSI
ncbi:MAG: GTPase HflX [Candidatus Hadarchaeales archaeon]